MYGGVKCPLASLCPTGFLPWCATSDLALHGLYFSVAMIEISVSTVNAHLMAMVGLVEGFGAPTKTDFS